VLSAWCLVCSVSWGLPLVMHPHKQSISTASHEIQTLLRRLPAVAAKIAQGLVFFVYPPICAGCARALGGEEPEPFCPDCIEILDLVTDQHCPICGIPYCADVPHPHLCGECLAGTYHFDRARAAGLYEGLLRKVIHRFKYGGETFLVRPLAKMLNIPAKELIRLHQIDLIVPVPLHVRRLRQRGFNQASLLARRLGSALKIPVNYSSLKRTRWTEPQIGLTRRQRAANVKGAFHLTAVAQVRKKGILLVDDVFTTGETVNQCVRVLKRDGGASEVVALTVARSVPV